MAAGSGPGGIEGQVYRGRDAYRDWLYKDLPEVWEDFHAEELEIGTSATNG